MLDAQGVDFLFLQELGGQSEAAAPLDRVPVFLGQQEFTAFVGHAPGAFRAQAVCLAEELVPFVERVGLMHAGLLVIVKRQGVRMFPMCLHLPHAQREDCIQVWETTIAEFDLHFTGLRYHDAGCIGADLNLEVFQDTAQDERRVHLEDVLLNHALSISHPHGPTWSNSRGSSSAIDYLMYRAPPDTLVDKILSGPENVVGTDHKPVWGDMMSVFPMGRGRKHLCGKWTVDGTKLLQDFNSIAENLELGALDFAEEQFVHACRQNAKRSGSLRYRDPPNHLDMVKARRRLSGREARDAAVNVLLARKKAKTLWLQGLLDRAASGDFQAAGYFRRRRHSSRSEMHGFAMRAGGFHKAMSEMKQFYRRKFGALTFTMTERSWPCIWLELGRYQLQHCSVKRRLKRSSSA